MQVSCFDSAAAFLDKTADVLFENEAANNLILGICLHLKLPDETNRGGVLLATAEHEDEVRVAAVMTPPHKLVICDVQTDYSEGVECLASYLHAAHWRLPGVLGPSGVAKAFAEAWSSVSAVPRRPGMHSRAYEIRKVIPPAYSPGAFRVATDADTDFVAECSLAFEKEALDADGDLETARTQARAKIAAQDMYLWEDHQPVSMAARARSTRHGVAVNHVYTPPPFRRRGYATSCVAMLSQLLLNSGRQFCCLFTDLANPTSNGIYQKIGYRPVCDFAEYVFDTPAEAAET